MQTGRDANEGRPPMSDSAIAGYRKHFVSKPDLFLSSCHFAPIVENCFVTTERFHERSNLVSAIVCE